MKEFDVLLAKYKDQKTDDVAQILYMEALLYQQVLQKRNERRSAYHKRCPRVVHT